MELLLRVLVGIVEVNFEDFEDDGDFENRTVGFAVGFTGERLFDLIGELLIAIGSALDLKIGFTFNGFFQADSVSDLTGNIFSFTGSSASFGALEGLLVNFDNFG